MCKEVDFTNISLLIIAGGQSSRMGQDKRFIELNGITLLENILIKASKANFEAVFLCVEERSKLIDQLAAKYEAKVLIDETGRAGPMMGLAGGLKAMRTTWALAVSCDMPFFNFEAVYPLLEYLDDNLVVMPPHQPLAAFYHKSMGELFQRAINEGQRKLRCVIEMVSHKTFSIESTTVFFNVNTPADLRLAKGRAVNLNRRIPILSIIAPASNTGKTTFIEKLIISLKKHNIKTGVVKSDCHGFNLDIEGKDSWRFQQAGAESVAVVSPNGWTMIQHTVERAAIEHITDKMDGIDLILTESRTHGTMPAISLYRGFGEPLINDEVAAIFTDKQIEGADDVLQCDINDIDKAAEICLFLTQF